MKCSKLSVTEHMAIWILYSISVHLCNNKAIKDFLKNSRNFRMFFVSSVRFYPNLMPLLESLINTVETKYYN